MADDHEATTLQDIIAAQKEEDRAERAYVAAKEELKSLKEDWAAARERRVSLVRNADQRWLPLEKPQPEAEPDAWRSTPIEELHLAERTLEKLADHDLETVGELVTLLYRGDLDSILIGQAGQDARDCLLRFHGGLPQAQADDFSRATTPGAVQPKPKRREKVAV